MYPVDVCTALLGAATCEPAGLAMGWADRLDTTHQWLSKDSGASGLVSSGLVVEGLA